MTPLGRPSQLRDQQKCAESVLWPRGTPRGWEWVPTSGSGPEVWRAWGWGSPTTTTMTRIWLHKAVPAFSRVQPQKYRNERLSSWKTFTQAEVHTQHTLLWLSSTLKGSHKQRALECLVCKSKFMEQNLGRQFSHNQWGNNRFQQTQTLTSSNHISHSSLRWLSIWHSLSLLSDDEHQVSEKKKLRLQEMITWTSCRDEDSTIMQSITAGHDAISNTQ